MGYWSTHPMGGDPPSDAMYELDSLLFTEEERDDDLHYDRTEYKERLQSKLKEASEGNYSSWCDCDFILPFTIVEYNIKIDDHDLSEKIKDMIGDGGAAYREYDVPSKNEKSFPKKENNWNNLMSPFDYARKLYDLWDEFMKGTIPFEAMEQDKGLFATIDEALSKNQQGLINKK